MNLDIGTLENSLSVNCLDNDFPQFIVERIRKANVSDNSVLEKRPRSNLVKASCQY